MYRERIQKEIKRVEEKYGIEVLYACETGSRAWGFPSPDSDYDVRMIYKHPLDWYLTLSEKKDNIEYMSEDKEIDLTGWDIRKSLKLLFKSNASLLERIQSPIVYAQKEGFVGDYLNFAKQCYSPISTLYHYLKLAEKSFEEVTVLKEYRLKRMFYALRGAMACKWIMSRNEMPPILFTKMVEELDISLDLKFRIAELIDFKATKSEAYMHSGEKMVFRFIEETILEAKSKANSLPGRKVKEVDLDSYFKKVVM